MLKFIPAALICLTLTACDFREYMPMRGYYAASTSMEPSLPLNTQFFAWKVTPAELRRGDIVIFDHKGKDRVLRLVGLPNDSIEMRDGIVILNDQAIELRPAGTHEVSGSIDTYEATMFEEQFPGESQPHYILDTGKIDGNNYLETTLGEDEYFLLGDNRDHSTDNRFTDDIMRIGIIGRDKIKRRVELN